MMLNQILSAFCMWAHLSCGASVIHDWTYPAGVYVVDNDIRYAEAAMFLPPCQHDDADRIMLQEAFNAAAIIQQNIPVGSDAAFGDDGGAHIAIVGSGTC